MTSGLTAEAKKILRKWAKADWYVYLRPLSSRYHDPKARETIYWTVQVDCRIPEMQGRTIRGEGYDLSEVITRLDLEVPERSAGYEAQKPGYSGWIAPKAAEERDQAARRAKVASGKGRRRKRSG